MDMLVLILAVLGFCSIRLSHSCTVSAPQLALNDIARSCNSGGRSRTPDCVAAMHRYCHKVSFPKSFTKLGVSSEVSAHQIGMSCVRSHWAGDVSINELKRLHGGCELHESQQRDCIAAIHRYCHYRFGESFAGTSQEVGNGVLQVHCFRSTRKENVPHSTLRRYHGHCSYPNIDWDACYAAASRWCRSLGYNGGITQEVGNNLMKVACYRAEFSIAAFTSRIQDFYKQIKRVKTVCSLDFKVDQGKILASTPEILKRETYDNRLSSVPLTTSFEVSKQSTQTSSFTHQHSFNIGAETTVSVKIPFVARKEITLKTSYTRTVSFTKISTWSVSYKKTSIVNVPPGKAIIKKAVLTRANLEVPWTAKIVNGLGTIRTISGIWQGVDTYDLKVTQEDL